MAAVDGTLSDWSGMARTHLCEAALRLLSALGDGTRFPDDATGLEALLERVAGGRPGEAMDFAVEPAGELPRYSGDHLVWVSAAAEGCLRLRHEYGQGLVSEAVILRPDGRLGEFETITGFGVPESELTDQARADRAAVERLSRERDADEVDAIRSIDESQQRFRTEHLLRVLAAPPQDPDGPVVSFVVLYDTGVIVYYLIARPPEQELETDDPWEEPLLAAMMPRIELFDERGTDYEGCEADYLEPNTPLLRASQSFTPAVPATASRLVVRFESTSVEIELGTE